MWLTILYMIWLPSTSLILFFAIFPPQFPVPNLLAFFQFLNFLVHSLSHRTPPPSYEVKTKYNPYLLQTFKSYLKRSLL